MSSSHQNYILITIICGVTFKFYLLLLKYYTPKPAFFLPLSLIGSSPVRTEGSLPVDKGNFINFPVIDINPSTPVKQWFESVARLPRYTEQKVA